MSPAPGGERQDVTRLLSDFVAGVPGVQDQLFPLIYDELHRLAAHKLRGEARNHSLCATELVNEAYMRLAKQRASSWHDRNHFLKIAARIIRRVLVDHARSRNAAKRGGDAERQMLSTLVDARALGSRFDDLDVLALEEALGELAERSAIRAQVVELRFFAGLSVEETAEVLGVHAITVKRHWKFARAWLMKRLGPAKEAGAP